MLLLGPSLVAAWGWLGLTGAVPLLLWWWHRWPQSRSGPLTLDPARVRAARLGPVRVRLVLDDGTVLELFRDELHPADAARLCRVLKYRLSVGGRLQDIEPV